MNQADEKEQIERWWAILREQIDCDGLAPIDDQDLLDTVRVVAHGVAHACGPLSAFAAGYAVGQAGGSAAATTMILSTIREAVSSDVQS